MEALFSPISHTNKVACAFYENFVSSLATITVYMLTLVARGAHKGGGRTKADEGARKRPSGGAPDRQNRRARPSAHRRRCLGICSRRVGTVPLCTPALPLFVRRPTGARALLTMQ